MHIFSSAFIQMKVPKWLLSPKGFSALVYLGLLLGQSPCMLLLRSLQGLEQLFLHPALLMQSQVLLQSLLPAQHQGRPNRAPRATQGFRLRYCCPWIPGVPVQGSGAPCVFLSQVRLWGWVPRMQFGWSSVVAYTPRLLTWGSPSESDQWLWFSLQHSRLPSQSKHSCSLCPWLQLWLLYLYPLCSEGREHHGVSPSFWPIASSFAIFLWLKLK